MNAFAHRGTAVAVALLFIAIPRCAHAQAQWSGSASGAFVEHRVRNGGTIETTSGPVIGVHGGVVVASWVGFDAYLLGGQLEAEGTTSADQRLTEIGTGVTVAALPWLALRAGANHRSYAATFAGQRWTALQLDAEARLPLLGGALHGVMQGRLMPLVWMSGNHPRPNLAIGAGTGLEWARRRFTAAISYALERYQFPINGGLARGEQLSSINLRFGLQVPQIPPTATVKRGLSR